MKFLTTSNKNEQRVAFTKKLLPNLLYSDKDKHVPNNKIIQLIYFSSITTIILIIVS